MRSYSLWTLIKPHRDGFMVTVSAIVLGSGELSQPGDYLTDYRATLEEATNAGLRLADHLTAVLLRRGDEIVSSDTTIEKAAGITTDS